MPRPVLFFLSLLLQLPLTAAAQDSAALAGLDSLLQGLNTLQAEVSQLIVESDGGVLEESEIRMKMKRPDGFYWETVSPFPELVVTDGSSLWNYQPDLEQVVVEPWESERSELAARLLSGDTDNLDDEYLVSLRDIGSSEFKEYELTPRSPDDVYRQIVLTFRGEMLDMIYVDSNNGQKTVWQFFNLEVNPPLQDSEFEFIVPAGVEVIRNNYVE